MSPVPSFPYEILWGERSIRSVANLTRRDGQEFFELAAALPLRVSAERLPLAEANEGLARLREGAVKGALVLACS
jgi:propanol-preferring alcohol dehydrogenase